MRKLAVAVAGLAMAAVGGAQVTERVDVDSNGLQSGAGASQSPGSTVSADGRYVVFMSSSILVPGDNNGNWDVFVRDRVLGATEIVSVDSNGFVGDGFSGLYGIAISADGRYVAFESRASNLVLGDTNAASDVFLRDRVNGSTERVSVATAGTQGSGSSRYPSLSADGRMVAFQSDSVDLDALDTNGVWDVFFRDHVNGTTERVSVPTGGGQGALDSSAPSVSADGRYVAFQSAAANLTPGDTNGALDIFLRDRQSGTTEQVSTATGGAPSNGASWYALVSGDGRYVAFTSVATNLVPGDTNGAWDVFARDRLNGTTERVSVATGGAQGNGSSGGTSISPDGRFVAFASIATNIVPGGTSQAHVFLRDRLSAVTGLVSVATDGAHANGGSAYASISSDGRYVAFRSAATNLVPGDTNGRDDVFLRDREATGFASLCEPSTNGAIACPCSNPPSGSGRGCDNSFSTGGASLSAGGIAYLSMDSLVFTTNDQTPIATSILLQGNGLVPAGAVFGQGVRCAGGVLKRLYVKTAVAGSITAPDLGAGDPTVSARSASLGDSIQAGQARFYLVFYRDPTVLGGCPASSTFNATHTGQVTWWP